MPADTACRTEVGAATDGWELQVEEEYLDARDASISGADDRLSI